MLSHHRAVFISNIGSVSVSICTRVRMRDSEEAVRNHRRIHSAWDIRSLQSQFPQAYATRPHWHRRAEDHTEPRLKHATNQNQGYKGIRAHLSTMKLVTSSTPAQAHKLKLTRTRAHKHIIADILLTCASNSREGINVRRGNVTHGGGGAVHFVVSVQNEHDVQCAHKPRVRPVLGLAQRIQHV